jgi:hypothetical protein
VIRRRLSPTPHNKPLPTGVLIAALLTAIALALVLTRSAYELRIKWGQTELEMRPTPPVAGVAAER